MPPEKHILVISFAGIGDTLFATPLIHELRANFPSARIDALVRWAGARDLLAGNPHLDHIYQKDLEQAGVGEALRFIGGLRRNRYEISLNTHPQSRIHYRVLARSIKAALRLSHQYHRASRFDRWLVHRTLPQDYSRHAIDNNLSLLGLLGAKPALAQHHYELHLSDAARAWAQEFIASRHLAGRRLLGIHAGSGGTKNLALRRWPLAAYIELIRRLNRTHPELTVLIFGGPVEDQDSDRILAQTDSGLVLRPKSPSLCEAAALVAQCDLFLSVDTVFMHLAAALKVPGQVVIETPTWNKAIEPYHQAFTLVKNPAVAGRNLEYYRYDGHGIRGSPAELKRCLESVTVEAVLAALPLELAATRRFP